MKKTLNKILIILLVILILFNCLSCNVYAAEDAGEDAMNTIYNLLINTLGAFVGVGTWLIRMIVLAITAGIQVLISGIASLGGVTASGLMVTPFTIFFNQVPLLDIDFMSFDAPTAAINDFRTAVATWYYIMRMIATAILLLILIYIGIRMALSTMAQDKVIYRKMLADWATSLAILYLLHYFIIFVINLNSSFIEILKGVGGAEDTLGNITKFITAILLNSVSMASGFTGIVSTLVYVMIVFQTLKFLLLYLKRMITIGFLIIISPLITITYSVDKIGDQRAQALNTWMKEFCYNILIQPFHCIMYLAFANVAFSLIQANVMDGIFAVISFIPGGTIIANVANVIEDTASGNNTLAAGVLALICLKFIDDGEQIIRKIFGFEKASSLGTAVAATAAVTGLVSNAEKIGKGLAGSKIGKNMFKNVKGVMNKDVGRMKSIAGGIGSKLDKVSNGKGAGTAKNLAGGISNRVGAVASGASKKINSAKEKVKNSGAYRAAKGTAEKVRDRKEERINKRAEKLAQKTYGKSLDSLGDNEQQALRDQARQSLSPASLGKRAITGAKTFVGDNKEAVSTAVGVVAAGAMYGAGSGGIVSALLAGIGAKGTVDGAFSNTKGQLKNDVSKTMQETTSVTGQEYKTEEDRRNHLNNVKILGDMGQLSQDKVEKDLEKLIVELQKMFRGLSRQDAALAAGRVQNQLAINPQGFNLESALKEALGSRYDNLSQENKNSLSDSTKEYLTTAQNAKLYGEIQAAEKVGVSTDDLARAVAGTIAVGTMASAAFGSQDGGTSHVETRTETETEITYETKDIDNVLRETETKLQHLSESLTSGVKQDVDSTMGELKDIMKRLEATNNKSGFSTEQMTQYNAIRTKFEQTIKDINSKK